MNGKCCVSSDGGRSSGYSMAVWRASHPQPRTRSGYAAACFHWSSERAYSPQACQAARAQCIRTGVYVGPYSGRQFAGMQRL
jgi:hypothetical protein